MSLSRIEIAERRLGEYSRWDIKEPSIKEVREAIERLDADRFSELNLIFEDGAEFTIGGGVDKFVVSVLNPDGDNLTLLNKAGSRSLMDVELIVGGQLIIIPQRYVNGKEAVIQAATFFFYHGSATTDLSWE